MPVIPPRAIVRRWILGNGLPNELAELITSRYCLTITSSEQMLGGYDTWACKWLAETSRGLLVIRSDARVHSDFYSANVICNDDQVVAIIAREVAFSIWEFGHNEFADALEPERARTFLVAYRRAAGGALEPSFAEASSH